jgi:hypothetical protein
MGRHRMMAVRDREAPGSNPGPPTSCWKSDPTLSVCRYPAESGGSR